MLCPAGGSWSYEQASKYLAELAGLQVCANTVDVYHALEHVSTAGKALYGERTAETTRWQEQARDALLAIGWPEIQQVIHDARANAFRAPNGQRWGNWPTICAPPHADRLNCAERLAQGRPIGSGLIEGACTPDEADRRPLADSECQSHGGRRIADLCRPMDRLLGKPELTPINDDRTLGIRHFLALTGTGLTVE